MPILLTPKAQTGLGTTANYPMGTYASVPTIYNEFIQKYLKEAENKKYRYGKSRDLLADAERTRQKDVNRKAYRDQVEPVGYVNPNTNKNIYSNTNRNI